MGPSTPRTCSRALLALAAALALAALGAAPAGATIRLSSARYSVSEAGGAAVITAVRDRAHGHAEVRYVATHLTAIPHVDYAPVKGRVDFEDGQDTATFAVRVRNRHVRGASVTVRIALFGAYPDRLGRPDEATLVIRKDAAVDVRDASNPLGLHRPPTGANPLVGARFFIDREWGLAVRAARHHRRARPSWSRALARIAAQPETKRFGRWDPDPGLTVQRYLTRAHNADPGAVPLLATYALRHVECGRHVDSPREQAAYRRWASSFARGIGNYRAVVFMEMDGVITMPCLSARGLRVRYAELRHQIDALVRQPHVVVYLDAGSADALYWKRAVRFLRGSGVGRIQGFFLNSTHFNWTTAELVYGQRIARALGGKRFVVSTAANGQGPLVPHSRVRYGNEMLCNPRGRGLGPKPTAQTGYLYNDGFFWIGNPGRSGGRCPGTNDPATGRFWVEYAVGLARRADYRVRGPRRYRPALDPAVSGRARRR